MTRLAIVDENRCKPKKCNKECISKCPVVRIGKKCIVLKEKNINIAENLCVGCGICVKTCPFKAIKIINLPDNLDDQVSHNYGKNNFKLYRLPLPRKSKILGLVGENGIGKSTTIKILAGKIKPNLGTLVNSPNWDDIIKYYRGSELQNYFNNLKENKISIAIKPQFIGAIPKLIKGKVKDYINNHDLLDMSALLDKDISKLSGGELQRFAIIYVLQKEADVYIFDEPSSYLDITQRIKMGKIISSLAKKNKYVIVIEHDLMLLDYISDYICCFYGNPGAYGVCSKPYTNKEGINIFLNGYIPSENMKFRETPLSFRFNIEEDEINEKIEFHYPTLKKTFSTEFELNVPAGIFSSSEIVVLLGKNGTGKSTFVKMLAGKIKPDNFIKDLNYIISYKPQIIIPKFKGTVKELLNIKLGARLNNIVFRNAVYKPMNISHLLDSKVKKLSGGELEKIALILCLGKPADLYLIDEPSSHLDSKMRIEVAKIIRSFIRKSGKSAFVIEHDFMMATYMADKTILFDGVPGKKSKATEPMSLHQGMNNFLKNLDITIRNDSNRPRINKHKSQNDQKQKKLNKYFT
jgi:ATP-binding cassette subfamily E protein 1